MPSIRQKLCCSALAVAVLWPAALPPAASAQVRLPSMGEGASADMGIGAERRLGDQIWNEVRRDASYLDDPVLLDYVQRLWWPLVEAATRKGEIIDDMRQRFVWKAFLIRDRSINAFALPGGYVGVHLGLVAGTATRDELVSVLAHELAHVTQRHIARGMESSGRQAALGIAAMLLGMIAASRSNSPDMAQAAIAGSQAAMIQGQLNFSRDMEREADRVGHTVMTEAGYGPAGMALMFDKLDKANRLNDSGNFPYLRSHPLTVERIAEAQARAGVEASQVPAADDEHELMRARARVMADPNVAALRSQLEAFRNARGTAPLGLAYGSALAAALLKDEAAWRETLPELRRAANGPMRRWVALLETEAQFLMPQAAWRAPAVAFASAAGWSRPELALNGRVLLLRPGLDARADADFRELHQALRAWVVREPQDGLMWQLLADCEEARGNRMGMLRAVAEVQLAAGRPDTAMVTLQSARRSARLGASSDAVELAVIDARLADLRRQRSEQFLRDGRRDPYERERREDLAAPGPAPVRAAEISPAPR